MPANGLHADTHPDPTHPTQQQHRTTPPPPAAAHTADGRPVPGLAAFEHGNESLATHETPDFSGERPFNRYGEGSGFSRQTPKSAKKTQPSALIINLAEERARRAKRLK
jgi:hypothetical protein